MLRATPAGFTLIELLITLAIIGILSAYAWPSYSDYIRRSRIAEPTGQLSILRTRMEQYYQDYRNYGQNDACGVPMPAAAHFSYACQLQNDGQGFLITASGVAAGNMAAFAYTIDHGGQRRTTALPREWGTVPQDCWVTGKGRPC